LKEERSYRVVLKNIHYSNNYEEIKTEIEKPEHMDEKSVILNNIELSYYSPCALLN
jgi:hypothetical protein